MPRRGRRGSVDQPDVSDPAKDLSPEAPLSSRTRADGLPSCRGESLEIRGLARVADRQRWQGSAALGRLRRDYCRDRSSGREQNLATLGPKHRFGHGGPHQTATKESQCKDRKSVV